jgi:flagellar hook-basal body complex protein FliE
MAVEPVAYLPATREIAFHAKPPSQDFGTWLSSAIGDVNQQLGRADRAVQSLAAGETQNLHQVMLALEEARIGVQLLVQVRNRLLEAYQEVLRMQV